MLRSYILKTAVGFVSLEVGHFITRREFIFSSAGLRFKASLGYVNNHIDLSYNFPLSELGNCTSSINLAFYRSVI